jgi:hypothetical protein
MKANGRRLPFGNREIKWFDPRRRGSKEEITKIINEKL